MSYKEINQISRLFLDTTSAFQIKTTNDLISFLYLRTEDTETEDINQLKKQINVRCFLDKLQQTHNNSILENRIKPELKKKANSDANLAKANLQRELAANDEAIDSFDDWQNRSLSRIKNLSLEERVKNYKRQLKRKRKERISSLLKEGKLKKIEDNDLYR